MVAMLLSTLVVGMVASVFLVQNEFYSDAVKRSTLHESVRGSASLVTEEIQEVFPGGVVAAESDSVTYRSPLAVGGVCGVNGAETYVLLPRGGGGVDAAEVSGYAVRDAAGDWSFTPGAWATFYHSSGSGPAQRCRAAGADTTGATADFYRLDGLVASPALQVGDLIMIYREKTLRLATSTLDSVTTALFTGSAGSTLNEYASGLTPASGFQYRLANQSHWRDRVAGGNRRRIDVVRFSARGAAVSARMGRDSITFNLTVSVRLQNAN
jgi:hypothetical protein